MIMCISPSNIAPLTRSSREDEWLCAGLDCLDFLPDLLVVELSRELSHCFLQDQDSCEQLPVVKKLQERGKFYTAHQRVVLLWGSWLPKARFSRVKVNRDIS